MWDRQRPMWCGLFRRGGKGRTGIAGTAQLMRFCGHVTCRPAGHTARSGGHIVCLLSVGASCSRGRSCLSTSVAHVNVRSRAGELARTIFVRSSDRNCAKPYVNWRFLNAAFRLTFV